MPVLQPARLLPKYCCAELEDTFASQRQSCLSTLIRVSICWQNVVRNLKVLQVSNSSSVVSIIFLYCTWGKKYSNEMPKMGLDNWHLSIRDSRSWVFRKKMLWLTLIICILFNVTYSKYFEFSNLSIRQLWMTILKWKWEVRVMPSFQRDCAKLQAMLV